MTAVTGTGRPPTPSRSASHEEGSGLVELLVAAALGLLGLAAVAAVARGPVAAASAAAAPSDTIEGVLLLRDVLAGAVRAADPGGVTPAGPRRLGLDGARGTTWLEVGDGAVRVAPPSGPDASEDAPDTPARWRTVLAIGDGAVHVRHGDPGVVVEIHVEVGGRPHVLALAPRAPS